MTLIEKYQIEKIKLSKTEHHILLFLDKEFLSLPNLNITTIANYSNSSTTSINRLVKKLNFKDYQDFKYFLKSRKDIPSTNSITEKSKLEINIFNFFTTFDFNILRELNNKIKSHDTIYLIAVGQSTSIAEYLTKHFVQLGKNIILVTESHLINTLHTYIHKNSLVIFISSSGNTNSLLIEAEILNKNRVHTYAITNNIDSKLQKFINKTITIPTTSFKLNGYEVYAQSPLFIFIDLLISKYNG